MTEYGGYRIDSDGGWGMKIIKTIGRGSLPNELRGSFTNTYAAQRAIDIVAAQKEELKDGPSGSSVRG